MRVALQDRAEESTPWNNGEKSHPGSGKEIGRAGSATVADADGMARFRNVFELANIAIALVDLEGKIFDVNQKLCSLLGVSREQLTSTDIKDLGRSGAGPWLAPPFSLANPDLPGAVSEMRFAHRDGNARFAEVCWGVARSQVGQPLYLVVSFRDTTGSKLREAMLEQQASIDPLTRTLNRARVEEGGKLEVSRSGRHGHNFSLLLVDLDHFKRVNDTYGHAAGDQVLMGFGDVARSCLRLSDALGRWGGEEFVILLPETGAAAAGVVAERLRLSVEDARFMGGIAVTASLGVACARKDEDFASLLARADRAMYRAKRKGRNQVSIDSEDLAMQAEGMRPAPTFVELCWRSEFQTGQTEIDAEHEEVFRMGNLVLASLASGADRQETQRLVGMLIGEVAAHCDHEESQLEAVRYPGLGDHRRKHREMLAKAEGVVERFARDELPAEDLLGFLVHDLVARHLMQEDLAYFPYLKGALADRGEESGDNRRGA